MVTITVCVGSSCHLKGARAVIMRFNELIKEYGLRDSVDLRGSFCMERCGKGLNWMIDEEPVTSVDAEDAVDTLVKKVLDPLAASRKNEVPREDGR